MTLIFTDEPDESFTGAAQPANGIYQPLLKNLPPFHQPWYKSRPIPTLPSQTVPDSKSAARYFTIRRICSLPILAVMSPQERGGMFRCGDPCIAQPEGRFAETGARRYGEEFCRVPAKMAVKAPGQQHRSPVGCLIWKPGLPATIKHAPSARTPVTIKRGDIVSWRLDNGLAHIGVVSDGFARDGTPLVIHNIGAGAQEEDVLFSWRMVGHYRYFVK